MRTCSSGCLREKRARGFVLFSILVFLQIFSLLSVYSLLRAAASLKQDDFLLQHERRLQIANRIMRQIEHRVETDQPGCLISRMPAYKLAARPLRWWELNACSGNLDGIRYYYAVEREELDRCAYAGQIADNHLLAVQYYRLTLLMVSAGQEETEPGYCLQSTVAVHANQGVSCSGRLRRIQIGRQMWREI
ncbi:hypothetical protein AQUSIP_13970 [Aquicella siphonis]|uniref:Uncharacterized protein n=1 Tax=Aquicella siphonis TaxID=254247 RepID=A0A5E4PI92_9COXI|nr:hypothetical protein [Aquicella siphonis]VVC76092.1 hypothetical protein AQUSIP_13970 [Aquicella siphonis]